MADLIDPIPLIDLQSLHRPIQTDLTAAINSVLDADDYILGTALSEFESAFAAACGGRYGVGMGSGSDAIAWGLRACGIGMGDEVIVPANTCGATLMSVLQTGAMPVLVDCDPATALIDLDAAEAAITPFTRAILPVHLYGQMVSPNHLLDLAERYDVLIVEEATQAHLAEREGYTAGSVGVAAAFSFHPTKNLGALGDGGMVVTSNAAIAETLRALRNYGSRKPYLHTDFGTNSRLDTLQAAVLLAKLPHLAEWNRDRNHLAHYYDQQLAPLRQHGIVPIRNCSGKGHAYHVYVVRVLSTCPMQRGMLREQLVQHGIQTDIHYPVACHLQPVMQPFGYSLGAFPNAEALSAEVLSLPLFPGLSQCQIDYIVNSISSAIGSPLSKPVLQ